jgi:hypothetical protein
MAQRAGRQCYRAQFGSRLISRSVWMNLASTRTFARMWVVAGVSKQLICPECGQVMAMAAWRPFSGLRITTPDGLPVAPVSDDLLLRIAEQRLASASAAEYPEAQRRRDAIAHNPGDRFYDIRCPRGHGTLKTAPEITRAIRRTPGAQVSLA